MKNLVWLLAILAVSACKPSRPHGVLSERKMEKVLVDYHLAQGMADVQDGRTEIERYRNVQSVFRKHHITEAQFDSSLVYYSVNAEKMREIYEHVVLKMETRATLVGVDAQASDKYANLTANGDTANIWVERKFLTMKPNQLDNMFRFGITADSTFRVGDSFLWRFRQVFRGQGSSLEARVMLFVTYADTSAVVSQYVSGTGLTELHYEPEAPLDSQAIRSLAGFIYIPLLDKNESKAFHLMLINDMSLIRFHKPQVGEENDEVEADTLEADTSVVSQPHASSVRLSPSELRDAQPREHKVNIRKEQPFVPQRRRAPNTQRSNRRR